MLDNIVDLKFNHRSWQGNSSLEVCWLSLIHLNVSNVQCSRVRAEANEVRADIKEGMTVLAKSHTCEIEVGGYFEKNAYDIVDHQFEPGSREELF